MSLALAKFFVTRMLTRDLFAVANRLVISRCIMRFGDFIALILLPFTNSDTSLDQINMPR